MVANDSFGEYCLDSRKFCFRHIIVYHRDSAVHFDEYGQEEETSVSSLLGKETARSRSFVFVGTIRLLDLEAGSRSERLVEMNGEFHSHASRI